VVFQDLALFPHLNVGNNIAYGPFIRRIPRRERRRITAEVLEMVKLTGFEKRRIETLSGGERQRVAIARALAASPDLLLLDEPFSSLDAPLRRELRREFAGLRSQSPIPCVFVTHDREEAAVLGDRIALMSGGKIVEAGPGREVFRFPKTEFGGRFLGSGQTLPCRITGQSSRGTRVESPLGSLTIPPGSECPREGALIFVPHDAISLEKPFDPPVSCQALLKETVFQGESLNTELELPAGTAGDPGIPFTLKTGPGTELPPRGSPVTLYVSEKQLRFVSASFAGDYRSQEAPVTRERRH
jgi:ABC-type Fe3+/spermidine/putrescine transport system ATPase subunit